MTLFNEIDKRIARALRMVRPAFRGAVARLDTGARVVFAQLKGLSGEVHNGVEMFQHFGFTSAPPDEAEVIVLPLLGKSGLAVVIASEDGRYRLRGLLKGESALYSQFGDYVRIHQGRIVEVKAATKVLVDAPLAEFTGDLKVAGGIEAGGEVKDHKGTMSEMRAAYDGHSHNPDTGVEPKMGDEP